MISYIISVTSHLCSEIVSLHRHLTNNLIKIRIYPKQYINKVSFIRK